MQCLWQRIQLVFLLRMSQKFLFFLHNREKSEKLLHQPHKTTENIAAKMPWMSTFEKPKRFSPDILQNSFFTL